MTMISNLPRDLEEEILSRVPVTSLSRLRSTCKGWYHHSLFKNPGFIKKHFDKTARQYKALMLMDLRVYSMRFSMKRTHIDPFLFPKEKLSLIDPHRNSEANISEAFHCDGILLCTTLEHELVVWNSFSGKTRWIQVTQPMIHPQRCYALGYDDKDLCHSFKILRFTEMTCQRVEIFEFSSNSWRNLDVSPGSSIEYDGVSLKGNTYWPFRPGVCKGKGYSLLSFDFSTERFQYLCVPFHQDEPNWFHCDTMSLSVVKEEHLSLLHQSVETLKIELWVTNEIETTFVSWSKFLPVDVNPIRYVSFFTDEEKKVAFCLDTPDGSKYNKVTIVGKDEYIASPGFSCLVLDSWHKRDDPGFIICRPTVFRYVPRLV